MKASSGESNATALLWWQSMKSHANLSYPYVICST